MHTFGKQWSPLCLGLITWLRCSSSARSLKLLHSGMEKKTRMVVRGGPWLKWPACGCYIACCLQQAWCLPTTWEGKEGIPPTPCHPNYWVMGLVPRQAGFSVSHCISIWNKLFITLFPWEERLHHHLIPVTSMWDKSFKEAVSVISVYIIIYKKKREEDKMERKTWIINPAPENIHEATCFACPC